MNRATCFATLAIAMTMSVTHAQTVVIVDSSNPTTFDTTGLENAGAQAFQLDGDTPNVISDFILNTMPANTTELLIGARAPGLAWDDSITIGQDLVISGLVVGAVGTTIEGSGTNPAIDIVGAGDIEVEVDDLTLLSATAPALRVSGATVFLIDCVFTSTNRQGVQLIGTDTNVVADRCDFTGNGQNGMLIQDNANLSLCYNSMFRNNGLNGILVQDTGNAALFWCTLFGNGSNGFATGNSSRGSLAFSLVHQNGTGVTEAGSSTITSNTNYVYANGSATPPEDRADSGSGSNWSGLSADGGSSTIFPDVDNSPVNDPDVDAQGELLSGTGPLVNRPIPGPPFGFELDFEGDPRPDDTGSNADIGADEWLTPGGSFLWTQCRVQAEDQLRSNFIGISAQGTVTIEISSSEEPDLVWISPQGADPTDTTARIEFNQEYVSGEESRWTNADRIQTVIDERAGEVGEPNQGDIIADGHGAVYIEYNGDIYGFPRDFPAENDRVVGQAQLGRHVIIDTIPPRLSTCRFDPMLAAVGNLGEPIQIAETNDTTTANHPSYGATFEHPYGPIPTTTTNGADWQPGYLEIPSDNGGIGYSEFATGGQGASAYINHASFSNFLYTGVPATDDLWLNVKAQLMDDVVRDSITGDPILGEDYTTDPVGAATVHQPGGFGLVSGGSPILGQFSYIINDVPFGVDEIWDFAKWRLASDSDFLAASTPVWFTGELQSGDPSIDCAGVFQGYDVETGTYNEDIQNILSARWDFSVSGGGAPGTISFVDEIQDDGYMKLALEFLGKDQAGNESTFQDDDSLLIEDTLNIWWMAQAAATLEPDRAGSRVELDDLSFNIEPDRNYDPDPVGQPRPMYCYRVWQAVNPGDGSAERDGAFMPLGDWTDWVPTNRIESRDIVVDFGPLDDHWLIIAVAIIDEAGNVSPFPTLELPVDGLGNIADASFGTDGTGWQKVFLTADGAVNTAINSVFWWDGQPVADVPGTFNLNILRQISTNEVVVGQNSRIIPSPPTLADHLAGRFTISFTVPDGAEINYVNWEFVKNGNESGKLKGIAVPQTPTSGSLVMYLPVDAWAGSAAFNPLMSNFAIDPNFASPGDIFPLEDTSLPVSARKSNTYLLRAWAVTNIGSSTTSGFLEDTTPATYSFTVIPESSVSAFVDPKDLPEDQPIRVNRQQ